MSENWKAIAGFEGVYAVSDLGRVRNASGRVLTPVKHVGGYRQAHLYLGGVRSAATIHGLVLEAFVGPRPAGAQAMHLNHDRADNRLVNLAWGSKAENEAAKVAAGRSLRGERSVGAKLTTEQVRAIRARRSEPQASLAAEFGCTFSNVSAIQLRKSWRHV